MKYNHQYKVGSCISYQERRQYFYGSLLEGLGVLMVLIEIIALVTLGQAL